MNCLKRRRKEMAFHSVVGEAAWKKSSFKSVDRARRPAGSLPHG